MSLLIQKNQSVQWRSVIEYYIFVFAFSYGLVGFFLLSGGSFKDASWVIFAQVSALAPAVTAILYTKFRFHRSVVKQLAMTPKWNKWLLISWLLALLLVCLALGVGLIFPGTYFDSSLQPAIARNLLSSEQVNLLMRASDSTAIPATLLLIPMGLILSVTMSLISGCGEELGWRGFVHTELKSLGFWKNSLITGMFWFIWHVPLLALGYGFPSHPQLGVALMGTSCMFFSIIAAYLREKSSAFAAGLFHGSTEAFMLLAIAPVGGGDELTVGMASVSWICALGIMLIGLIIYDRFFSDSPIIFHAP